MREPSAGIMRAVIAAIATDIVVVDITHDVDKFAVRDGALHLWSAVPYLPVGAHVAVVDPGVGTARHGIAMQTLRGDYLVGPDNGLLMPAAARLGGITKVHVLEDPRYRLARSRRRSTAATSSRRRRRISRRGRRSRNSAGHSTRAGSRSSTGRGRPSCPGGSTPTSCTSTASATSSSPRSAATSTPRCRGCAPASLLVRVGDGSDAPSIARRGR